VRIENGKLDIVLDAETISSLLSLYRSIDELHQKNVLSILHKLSEDGTFTMRATSSSDLGSSKNILNTTLKKMGRRHKMNVFSVLITVMLLACSSLDVSW